MITLILTINKHTVKKNKDKFIYDIRKDLVHSIFDDEARRVCYVTTKYCLAVSRVREFYNQAATKAPNFW